MIVILQRLVPIGPAFLRFGLVGLVGFLVDAGVLLALLAASSLHAVPARLFSFLLAVLTTYELNRRWTFRHANGGYFRHFVAYVGVQGLGFLSNVAIYTALLFELPPPYNAPLVCLAAASGAALLINFIGSQWVVFRRRGARPLQIVPVARGREPGDGSR